MDDHEKRECKRELHKIKSHYFLNETRQLQRKWGIANKNKTEGVMYIYIQIYIRN